MPGNIRSTPKLDVYGRPEESILSYNGNNILGQYTYYRKHGDHATNQVSSIRYGVRRDSRFEITEGLKYAYDKNGNIEKVFENGQLTVRYTYDTLNRLVREDNRKLDKTFLFTYDGSGNILSKREMYCNFEPTGKLTAQKEMLYRYDAVNGDRLNGVSERVISGSYYCGDTNCGEGHASGDHVTDNYMAYDAMGNPTTYKGKTLVWQLGRQLRSYDIHVFDYDGYGRRIAKGNTTYTYSANGTLLKQTDGTNTLEFIYDNGTAAGVKINGTQYLYRRNLQGDVTHIYGIDGTLYACYTYDAWGCCTIGTDINNIGTINPLRYRGYYWDAETGLYFLQSRYYDPQFGRFINADDVAYLDAGTVNGLNLYAYCGNNPVNLSDSTGCSPWWSWLISGLQIAVGAVLVATGVGAGLGAMLLVGGVMGMVTNALGSQIGGGIGSMMNGWGAISTGMSLMGFGPIGWILGGISIAVGAATMIMGANEVIDGVFGYNPIKELTGMSDSTYGGLYLGLNIASSVATIAGRLGMRAVGTKTIGSHDQLKASGQKPYARITRGTNTYNYNGRGNAYWSKHNVGMPNNRTPSGLHWHTSMGRDGNHIYSYIELLISLIFGG